MAMSPLEAHRSPEHVCHQAATLITLQQNPRTAAVALRAADAYPLTAAPQCAAAARFALITGVLVDKLSMQGSAVSCLSRAACATPGPGSYLRPLQCRTPWRQTAPNSLGLGLPPGTSTACNRVRRTTP